MEDHPPILVSSTQELKGISEKLAGRDRYFLDTEFEKSARTSRLCLVQVSGGREIYVIDTLRLSALAPLAAAIARPDVEWVLHAGDQDVAYLQEAMGIVELPRLFDTQVAWGLLGPEYPVSLAYLLYRILGIRSMKEHQAGDWTARPLSEEQVAYAAGDVAHLPALRDQLADRLAKLGRLELVREVSAETAAPSPLPPLSLEDFRNAWQLDAAGQAALLHLIDWHNGLAPAEKREAPLPNVLLSIAKMLPESGAELAKIRGVYFPWAKQQGDSFTGQLMRASMAGTKGNFKPLEPPTYNTFEQILAEGWIRKAVSEVSVELGLSPELAFPARLVRSMTRAVVEKGRKEAASDELVGWRAKLLRDRLLAKCGG